MRIISKFYDYYDKACAHGIDPDLVYVRETKEIVLGERDARTNQEPVATVHGLRYTIPNVMVGAVAFCGRVYPVYQVWLTSSGPKMTFHSIADLVRSIGDGTLEAAVVEAEKGVKPTVAKAAARDYVRDLDAAIRSPNRYRQRWLEQRFEEADRRIGAKVPVEIFLEHGSPILAVEPKTYVYGQDVVLQVNPRLNQYDFAKVFDPVSAFQEVSMFLGSAMARQVDPTVDHSDELKAEIHGFDKWSFRRHRDDRKGK